MTVLLALSLFTAIAIAPTVLMASNTTPANPVTSRQPSREFLRSSRDAVVKLRDTTSDMNLTNSHPFHHLRESPFYRALCNALSTRKDLLYLNRSLARPQSERDSSENISEDASDAKATTDSSVSCAIKIAVCFIDKYERTDVNTKANVSNVGPFPNTVIVLPYRHKNGFAHWFNVMDWHTLTSDDELAFPQNHECSDVEESDECQLAKVAFIEKFGKFIDEAASTISRLLASDSASDEWVREARLFEIHPLTSLCHAMHAFTQSLHGHWHSDFYESAIEYILPRAEIMITSDPQGVHSDSIEYYSRYRIGEQRIKIPSVRRLHYIIQSLNNRSLVECKEIKEEPADDFLTILLPYLIEAAVESEQYLELPLISNFFHSRISAKLLLDRQGSTMVPPYLSTLPMYSNVVLEGKSIFRSLSAQERDFLSASFFSRYATNKGAWWIQIILPRLLSGKMSAESRLFQRAVQAFGVRRVGVMFSGVVLIIKKMQQLEERVEWKGVEERFVAVCKKILEVSGLPPGLFEYVPELSMLDNLQLLQQNIAVSKNAALY
jgi:hypothetical protein